ncbi:MAG TPA: hypothetical protein VEX86_26100 [Longimicrobium sp.]|nr:hypothetical protein [Longimicrobium sp.]
MLSQNVLATSPGPTYDGSGRITNLRPLIINTLNDTIPSQGLTSGVRWLFIPKGSYTWNTPLTESDLPSGTTSLRFYSDGATLYDTRAANSGYRFWFQFVLDATVRPVLQVRFEGKFTFDGSTGATPSPAPADSRAVILYSGWGAEDNQRARGFHVGPDVTFQHLTYEATSTNPPGSTLVDHALRVEQAADVRIHCQSSNVKGWTVWLEVVDDFLVSDCVLRGNSWGAIELRRSCRNGVVANNRVYGCEGRFGAGIDLIGLSTQSGSTLVANERISVMGNYFQCRSLYGAGLRIKGARHVDVIGNTVEIYGAAGPQTRAGIVIATKQETEGTDRPGGACADVRVQANRVVTTVTPTGGDLIGGILGLNPPAITGGPYVAANLAIVDNELVEDGGQFNYFGIRYGGAPTGASAEQQTNGLVIRDNFGSATCAGVNGDSQYGGIVVRANRDTGSTSIRDLEIQGNSLVSAHAVQHSHGIRVYGRVQGGSLARNSVSGYHYGIARDLAYTVFDEYANSELGCVEPFPADQRPSYPQAFGTAGKPGTSTVGFKRVSAGTLFRETGTAKVKGWYARTKGQFSTQTATVTATAANKLSVTVSGVADFQVGDRVTVGSQGERVLSRVDAATSTLHFFQALGSAISSGAVSHVAPDLVAIGEGAGGTTAERPTSSLGGNDVGFVYFDSTLGKPIFWNGSGWRDATGAAV